MQIISSVKKWTMSVVDCVHPSIVSLHGKHGINGWVDFIYLFIYLFIYWLRWVFVAVCGLSLVAASRGYSSLLCEGFSLRWLLLLQSMGSRCTGFSSCGTWASVVVARGLQSAGSVVAVHGLSCSATCGIFPEQGLNPCPLQWQADS